MNARREKQQLPFGEGARASKKEIQAYLNTFIEEYRNITKVDLPQLCERFPLWAYPTRVVAGVTSSKVYVLITRDGDPKETRVEIYESSTFSKLGQVMDVFKPHQEEVAKILGIDSAVSILCKEADENQFSDDIARSDAVALVKKHYKVIEASGKVSPKKFFAAKLSEYVPPVSFLENHIESSELKNKIQEMLGEAKKEIMVSCWLDTFLLEIFQRKSKEGVKIRVLTKKPGSRSPTPVKTAYKKLVDIAEVKRNNLRHFRIIICDRKQVLISSSDLTTHSLSQNFEAGIWTSSPIVVRRAVKLFERVWKNKDTVDVNQEQQNRK